MEISRKLYNIKNRNIEKKLEEADINSEEELLLLEAPSPIDEVFRKLEITSKKQNANNLTKNFKRIKIVEKKFKGMTAYLGEDIKKLCISHFLSILSIDKLEAIVSNEAAQELKEFTNKYEKTSLSASNFYILCGREFFYPAKHTKEVKDLIIFYKESKKNDHNYNKVFKDTVLIQVYASKEDFNSLRIFKTFFQTRIQTINDNVTGKNMNILILIILIFSLLAGYFNAYWLSLIFVVFYIIISYIFNTNLLKDSKTYWNDKA